MCHRKIQTATLRKETTTSNHLIQTEEGEEFKTFDNILNKGYEEIFYIS